MKISKLKKEKATGHDQILVKLIKEGGRQLRKPFFNSFKKYERTRSYHISGNVP
jgi:hypothetical protein